jgi:adenine-specific DNA methylase
LALPPNSLDGVFTDPPYFGNVQYGELMDFCYAWLRRLVGQEAEGFDRASTRSPDELTGNTTQARGLEHFTDGLAAVYTAMARALKPGAPLAFTFHHNRIEAYHAIGVAILDSGLTCTASLPCPAEMGGSIHIYGTGSSILDTVFVCRAEEQPEPGWHFTDLDGLGEILTAELAELRAAGVKPSLGDIRCLVFGHLTRMAIQQLRKEWDAMLPSAERLSRFAEAIAAYGDLAPFISALAHTKDVVEEADEAALYTQEVFDAISL